jgi:hypothetical protein
VSHLQTGEMIDQLIKLKKGKCAAYGFDTYVEISRVIWPLLLTEIRRRNLCVVLRQETITNESGGYLYLYSRSVPGFEDRLRGRNIVAGNAQRDLRRLEV